MGADRYLPLHTQRVKLSVQPVTCRYLLRQVKLSVQPVTCRYLLRQVKLSVQEYEKALKLDPESSKIKAALKDAQLTWEADFE